MPEAAKDKPLEVWWQDEARVGQQGTLTYVWAECGSRPRVPRDLRYEWAYLFGAVCPGGRGRPPVPFTGQTVGGTVAPLTDRAGPPGATFCPLCREHLWHRHI